MKKGTDSRILILVAIIWTAAAISSFPHVSSAEGAIRIDRAINGNPQTGKQLFEKRCTGCHSLDKNKEGPRLRDVYGRRSGSIADFSYSDELKAAHILWDEGSLDQWLTNPEAVVPNNDMAFHVPNPQERADIIQFLRQSSGK
ncbi:c-type cytochrome [Telmatobacter sp. DSM 110680]|uniref:C-type cytochrome n=1 Tax=Telmatobacter sp. DSM 110680 TaxID=3036704 RepID=A0AAU7DJ71_9BACT